MRSVIGRFGVGRLGKFGLNSIRRYSNGVIFQQKVVKSLPWYGIGTLATFIGLAAGVTKVYSDDLETVVVSSKVSPFPVHIKSPLIESSTLIGHGIREVSFLRMQVYALGLYIADSDKQLVSKVLHSKFLESFYEKPIGELTPPCEGDNERHSINVHSALNDKNISTILIDSLLDAGVRFSARICAIRNTDLSHLRDGFVRTICNNPNYSKLLHDPEREAEAERIVAGLDELRAVFNSAPRGKTKKNEIVFVELCQEGALRVVAGTKELGIVHEPLVGRLLFEGYLSAEKPLVPRVQQGCAESLSHLV